MPTLPTSAKWFTLSMEGELTLSTWNPPPIPSNPQLDYLSSLSCPFTLIPYVRPMPLEMGCDPASPDADSTACTHISSDITAPETQVYTFHGTLESITFNGETISPDAFNGKDLNSGHSFFQVGLALIENFR